MQTRPPTHSEAVDWLIRNAGYREYRGKCVALWKSLLGDVFGQKVENEANAKIGKGKK